VRVLWRRMLTDGHAIQVVYDPREPGRKLIEVVGDGDGSNLETEGSEECIRFEVRHVLDWAALEAAINEVWPKSGQSGGSISDPADPASTESDPEKKI
jgi:hypothetical protein